MTPPIRPKVDHAFANELNQAQAPKSSGGVVVTADEAQAIVEHVMKVGSTAAEIGKLIADQKDYTVRLVLGDAFKDYVDEELDSAIGYLLPEQARAVCYDDPDAARMHLGQRSDLFLKALDFKQRGYSNQLVAEKAEDLRWATTRLSNALKDGSTNEKQDKIELYREAYEDFKNAVDTWDQQVNGMSI